MQTVIQLKMPMDQALEIRERLARLQARAQKEERKALANVPPPETRAERKVFKAVRARTLDVSITNLLRVLIALGWAQIKDLSDDELMEAIGDHAVARGRRAGQRFASGSR